MFKQTWWVSLAAVLAGLQVFFAVGFGVDPDASATARVVLIAGLTTWAALILIGIMQRRRQRRRGDLLIAFGVVPSALAGIAIFWFPPMWLITVAGLSVMVLAIRDAVGPVRIANP